MKKICCLFLLIFPIVGFCISWQNLWFTPDQQAAKLLRQNELEAAAEMFTNPLWQGYAYYKSGQFQKAMQNFRGINTPLANFNYGNTLVHLGQYQAAIAAYTNAIQQMPEFTDAIYNKSLLEKFLNQSSSNNQNQQQNQAGDTQNNDNSQNSSDSDQKHANSDELQLPKNQNATTINSEQEQQVKSITPEKLNAQQVQVMKQWLQQIPDNPGGLLKQKFLRDHLRIEAESNR